MFGEVSQADDSQQVSQNYDNREEEKEDFGRLCIVYCQVCWVPYILHFEPALDAMSLRSGVIRSIKR